MRANFTYRETAPNTLRMEYRLEIMHKKKKNRLHSSLDQRNCLSLCNDDPK